MKENAAKRRGRPRDVALTARRREEILDVAASVFAEHGFPNTDVQWIADRLEVGKGTIYRYFPTKRELFLAAVDRGLNRLEAQVDAALVDVDDPFERFSVAVRAYLAFFDANPELVELLIQERAEFKDRKKPTYFEHREAGLREWQELLRGLVDQGRVRNVPLQRITEVAGDLLYGTVLANYFAGRRASMETQAQDILDIVFHGILTDEERARSRAINRFFAAADGRVHASAIPRAPQAGSSPGSE
jgi:AcrR family transcriptional regulator